MYYYTRLVTIVSISHWTFGLLRLNYIRPACPAPYSLNVLYNSWILWTFSQVSITDPESVVSMFLVCYYAQMQDTVSSPRYKTRVRVYWLIFNLWIPVFSNTGYLHTNKGMGENDYLSYLLYGPIMKSLN